MENAPYIQDELVQYVRGEIEWLTYLGEPFDKALVRTRQQLIDAIDASLIVAGLWRDFEREQVSQEVAAYTAEARKLQEQGRSDGLPTFEQFRKR